MLGEIVDAGIIVIDMEDGAREYSEDILDNDPFAKIEQQRWALATTG